jgi:hypothetical protein
MYSVSNCQNIAKHIGFSCDSYGLNATSTYNAGYFKKASQWYSECYCVTNVTKMFTLKSVQTIHRSRCQKMDALYAFKYKHFRNTRHTVTFGIPLRSFILCICRTDGWNDNHFPMTVKHVWQSMSTLLLVLDTTADKTYQSISLLCKSQYKSCSIHGETVAGFELSYDFILQTLSLK